MRWAGTLVFAFLISATAAEADVTARYVLPTIGNAIMTVEADSQGNSRISVNGEPVSITMNDLTYAIWRDERGTFAVLQDDMEAVAEEMAQRLVGGPPIPDAIREDMADHTAPTQAGRETVGSRDGALWRIGPDLPITEGNEQVVISADPDLAPVGRALARQFRSDRFGRSVSVGPLGLRGEMPPRIVAVFRSGTIIRYGNLARLDDVHFRPVAASAFSLPGPVLARAEFASRIEEGMCNPR